MIGILLDLGTQAVHIDRNLVAVSFVIIAPHSIHQQVMAQDTPCIAHQTVEKAEFDGRQLGLATAGRGPGR